jgi:hypothetical protein
MCNCKSYNKGGGIDEEVVCYPPKHLGIGRDSVCVDFCIAKVVIHLWGKGVVTLNSCCGHNKRSPSVVLGNNITIEEAKKVKEFIAEVDSREWDVLSWVLTCR